MRILVVDDSITMRRIVRRFFANNGFYNILEGRDGEDGLMELEKNENKIDLIISDLNMPIMNGMELLEKVKNNPGTDKIPFIMLTVESNQKTMNKAITLMVDSYIVKPVSEEMFMAEVERVLKAAANIKYL